VRTPSLQRLGPHGERRPRSFIASAQTPIVPERPLVGVPTCRSGRSCPAERSRSGRRSVRTRSMTPMVGIGRYRMTHTRHAQDRGAGGRPRGRRRPDDVWIGGHGSSPVAAGAPRMARATPAGASSWGSGRRQRRVLLRRGRTRHAVHAGCGAWLSVRGSRQGAESGRRPLAFGELAFSPHHPSRDHRPDAGGRFVVGSRVGFVGQPS
jgi:hypothetical protein